MAVRPPDDINLDSDILDLDELERGGPGPVRRPRTPPQARTKPPSSDESGGGSWTDPRFLVPLLLFLSAVFVIGMAVRSGTIDDGGDEPRIQVQSELALAIRDAELRAGFDGLTITEDDGSVVIEGEARDALAAASIGAVARSVDGTQRVDNRVVVAGGAISASTPTSIVTTPVVGLDQQLADTGDITFETGSASLTPEGSAIVDSVAAILNASPGIRVEIHGHTDSDGDDNNNQVLSQDRAQAVAVALGQRGVDTARLTPVGFGESKPLEPNITEEGRAVNRRIEFLVVG